ncbi:MAG: hypothetical protein A3G52_03470 [Candidatus Taylorbacteria bacterium RIFCSPLOWO2_12_FULL_43_20]|uniref:Polysaccharide biosynthesis protein C-terminal domain-containing protein n=1 Tax=Candidatus Taylorbacteria bacterium RIFCSPLOWO2_12_FULL_43_20 TaxID=1802332 RepID=A0A1G2P0M0_9BACT|nr:MAG: hypothetical protein A2825_02415 [Candidatus Taylorbacteria bacterium RIFCSPHIGHO2_01_FULL_43_120]OHA22407.1 MAG: hypothetical protein A3B98_02315 [Candidatus Taylorbacteria bacterium RIFCSPHIGHO2_02_FULL_43_55]OHA28346.1 MAG: hypothetical protein A3E92_00485 [Candidatus Taylorbacteria bacterium RIFCSPHIGHO2_12_FULL_42_34]OHA30620.1 MAG: hypothetical protein A3B09_00365 [Candidatus Taylorbacteria bacterium RIFCSPLOWO2_01_FULL_43_83]OHA38517.1 MAG: hypothetical protein A3H58_03010 [Candi
MATLTRKIIEGTVATSLGNILLKFTAFVSFIIITSQLSLQDYGILNLFFTVAGPAAAFSMISLERVVVADAASYRGLGKYGYARKLISDYFKITLVLLTSLLIISWFLKVLLTSYFSLNISAYFWPLAFFVIGQISMNFISVIFEAYERFKSSALFQFGEAFIRFVVVLSLFHFGFTLLSVFMAYIISKILVVVLSVPFAMRAINNDSEMRFSREPDVPKKNLVWDIIKKHGKWEMVRDFPSKITGIAAPWLLRITISNEAVGLFSFAQKIYSFISSAFPLTSIIFPIISRSISENVEKTKLIIVKAQKYLLYLYLPMYIAAYVMIGPIIKTFIPHYIAAVLLIKIVLFDLFIDAFSVGQSAVLYGLKQQKLSLLINMIMQVIILASQIVLITSLGVVGASISVLVTGFSSYLLRRYILEKKLNFSPASGWRVFFTYDEYDKLIVDKIKNNLFRYACPWKKT